VYVAHINSLKQNEFDFGDMRTTDYMLFYQTDV